jgi:hypothetical protein
VCIVAARRESRPVSTELKICAFASSGHCFMCDFGRFGLLAAAPLIDFDGRQRHLTTET